MKTRFILLIALVSSIGAAPYFFSSSCALAEGEVADSGTGIGPVKKIELAAIDPKLAEKGKGLFTLKCSACHKLPERYVGPALAGVTKRRRPEWIMNMMLNPQEMIQKDSTAQDLFAEFLVPMTFQNVTEADARAILEYLRSEEK